MKNYNFLFLFLILFIPCYARAQVTQFYAFLDSIGKISSNDDKIAFAENFLIYAETQGIPYIEGDTAHFIYYGNGNTVVLAGDFNGWGGSGTWQCIPLPGTDFFYYSETFEPTARLDYKYVVDGNWILDPRNPNTCTGGYGPNSELAMPGYVQPWEIQENPGVSKGTLEIFTHQSTVLGENFQVQVYLPPGYEAEGLLRYQTLYAHDGQEYIGLAEMNNVIDNLIDSSLIDPIIGIFIRPNNRNDLYAFTDRFEYAEYIAEELVPFIDDHYLTLGNAQYRLTMGASFGGNISGLIAYNYPEVFLNTGWHSPALWPNNGEVANLFTGNPKNEIKVYFNHGTYEDLGIDWTSFTTGLDALGYEFDWKTFHEGHSWGLWRATIDDILKFFFPAGSTPLSIDNADNIEFLLGQNYPNPFQSRTNIMIRITHTGNYTFKVFNILGEKIFEKPFYFNQPGNQKIVFDGKDLKAGIYYYLVEGDESKKSRAMIIH